MNFSTISTQAQLGVTPASYTSLSAWWDAAALNYAEASPIDNTNTTWKDKSGNANHLVQATATMRPVLMNSIVNSRDNFGWFDRSQETDVRGWFDEETLDLFSSLPGYGVRFDGAASPNNDNLFLTSALTFTNAAAFTVIVVGLVNADSLLFGSSSTNVQFRRYQSSGETMSYFDTVGAITSTTLSTPHNAVHMMTWRRVVTTGAFTFRENKTDRTSGSPASGFTVVIDRMGVSNSVFSQLNGDIGEAVIYSEFRTDAEVDNLYNNYFKPKWGLP